MKLTNHEQRNGQMLPSGCLEGSKDGSDNRAAQPDKCYDKDKPPYGHIAGMARAVAATKCLREGPGPTTALGLPVIRRSVAPVERRRAAR